MDSVQYTFIQESVTRHLKKLAVADAGDYLSVDWAAWAVRFQKVLKINMDMYDHPAAWLRAFALWFDRYRNKDQERAILMLLVGVVATEQPALVRNTEFIFGQIAVSDDTNPFLHKVDGIVRAQYRRLCGVYSPREDATTEDSVSPPTTER